MKKHYDVEYKWNSIEFSDYVSFDTLEEAEADIEAEYTNGLTDYHIFEVDEAGERKFIR